MYEWMNVQLDAVLNQTDFFIFMSFVLNLYTRGLELAPDNDFDIG